MGHWQDRARMAIRNVLADHVDLHDQPEKLFKLVSKAYPFGMRRHHPYKVWLEEVAKARAELAKHHNTTHSLPQERFCKACGAKPGQPCKGMGDYVEDILAIAKDAEDTSRFVEATQILTEAFHQTRIASTQRMVMGNGPLFGDDFEDEESSNARARVGAEE